MNMGFYTFNLSTEETNNILLGLSELKAKSQTIDLILRIRNEAEMQDKMRANIGQIKTDMAKKEAEIKSEVKVEKVEAPKKEEPVKPEVVEAEIVKAINSNNQK